MPEDYYYLALRGKLMCITIASDNYFYQTNREKPFSNRYMIWTKQTDVDVRHPRSRREAQQDTHAVAAMSTTRTLQPTCMCILYACRQCRSGNILFFCAARAWASITPYSLFTLATIVAVFGDSVDRALSCLHKWNQTESKICFISALHC